MTHSATSTETSIQSGATMKYSISENPRFQGAFIAHTPQGDIECANIHTALSYIPNTRQYRQAQAIRPFKATPTKPTIEVAGYCSPTGQYYAVVEFGDFDVRIDCHIVHTLRGWMKDGVTGWHLCEAFQDATNIRPRGGWVG